jgi:hypothetical protein
MLCLGDRERREKWWGMGKGREGSGVQVERVEDVESDRDV